MRLCCNGKATQRIILFSKIRTRGKGVERLTLNSLGHCTTTNGGYLLLKFILSTNGFKHSKGFMALTKNLIVVLFTHLFHSLKYYLRRVKKFHWLTHLHLFESHVSLSLSDFFLSIPIRIKLFVPLILECSLHNI